MSHRSDYSLLDICILLELGSPWRILLFSFSVGKQKIRIAWCYLTIGGSRGGVRDARPPPGRPNSFNFMQFSGKFGVFTPPWRVHAPPQENPGSATAYPVDLR